jgi:pimeloyl-ACP methyl ester carboxylesterase
MTTSGFEDLAGAADRHGIWYGSNGDRLFALDIGRGRPIVFLHGGLADHRAALLRVGALATSRRLLLPDLRGSGRSVHGGTLSWDRLADDVDALLAHLGIERAVVGGTSMGSGVALRFALRHPRRTAGLVLMSPVYPGEDRGLTVAQDAAMRTMDEAGQRALVEGVGALRPLFERLPPPIRDAAIAMMLGFDAASVAATTGFLASTAQPMGTVRELEAIAAPVMIVPGVDPEHPAEVATLYARHLRHSVLVDPLRPDLVEEVARFCDGLDAPSTA